MSLEKVNQTGTTKIKTDHVDDIWTKTDHKATDVDEQVIDPETSVRGRGAMELFKEGYNCSQSVILAFEDILGYDRETLARFSSSFGGGMGRLREVCGSVSAMFMVLGILYGYSEAGDITGKAELYARVQELAHQSESINGSIVCRELLNLNVKSECPIPEARSDEYYRKRPCVRLVGISAALVEEYIAKHPNFTKQRLT